jgi:hypothetical protein
LLGILFSIGEGQEHYGRHIHPARAGALLGLMPPTAADDLHGGVPAAELRLNLLAERLRPDKDEQWLDRVVVSTSTDWRCLYR